MKILSPAKINLSLNVLGKLPNRYHELLTVFYLIPSISDTLVFEESDSDVIEIENGGSPITLSLQDNLIYKMAESIRRKYNINKCFKCTIDKKIPIGAGLGGGSSNAVAALRGLEELWGFEIPLVDKEELCAGLGSDLNFFLHADAGTPLAVGRGRGEAIEPYSIDTSWLHVAIIQPRFSLSTRDVFCNVSPSDYTPADKAERHVANILDALRSRNFPALLANLSNDLSAPAVRVDPSLAQCFDDINGIIAKEGINTKLMLSGSGSCLFALFNDRGEKDRFVSALNSVQPGYKKIYC